MQLYHSPSSPFVRKVLVVLHETGLSDGVTLVAASGNPLAPGSMPVAQNPLGKIPVLLLDDGRALYDSRVICRYVDARAGGRHYPEGERLWDTLTLEATADGVLEAAVLMRYETHVRPEDCRSPDWIEAQWTKIARALDALTDRWADHLAGPIDIGQIAVGCALGYLDLRFGDRNWRGGRDRLASWEANFARRPSMVATTPAG